MKKKMFSGIGMAAVLAVLLWSVGCATHTTYIPEGTRAQTVAGYSLDDIEDAASRALVSLLNAKAFAPAPGEDRTVMIVDDVKDDTCSRGRDSEALAEALGIRLRKALTNGGKVLVLNPEAAQQSGSQVAAAYLLQGRLAERRLRQDNGDLQIEYHLNLQLIQLASGLETWQETVPIRKVTSPKNVY